MQNFNASQGGAADAASRVPRKASPASTTRSSGTGPYSGCNVPLQFYEYHTNPERWSDELRLASKPGGRFHWLAGLYWEKTIDKNSSNTYYMPGLQYQRCGVSEISLLLLPHPADAARRVSGTRTPTRSDYLQTTEFANISFDVTDRLNVEAGVVHFQSDFRYDTPFAQFAYYNRARACTRAARTSGTASSASTTRSPTTRWCTPTSPRVSVTAAATSAIRHRARARQRRPRSAAPLTRPIRSTTSRSAGRPPAWNGRLIWNGAAYYMDWKQLQALIYDPLSAPPPASTSTSAMRASTAWSRTSTTGSTTTGRCRPRRTTPTRASFPRTPAFQAYVGERLPFAPYFSWSWNAALRAAAGPRAARLRTVRHGPQG